MEERFSEIEWTIENISCWNREVHGTYIESTVGQGSLPSWTFKLYPRYYSGIGIICCVWIDTTNNLFAPSELSFLCSDGSLIHSRQMEGPGEIVGPNWGEVLGLIKGKEEDSLTIRYRLRSEEEKKQKYHTVINVFETTLKINRDALGCGERISCFTFHKNTGHFCGYLSSVRNGNEIQLEVEIPHIDGVLFFKSCLSFLKTGDELERYEEKKQLFRGLEKWVLFSINEKEIDEIGTTVLLRLKIITRKRYFYLIGVKVQRPGNGVSIVPNKKPSKSPIVPSDDSLKVLTKDFLCLFRDRKFSDFQLKCGGVSFPVHRAVLSARSPVFECLLCSDMREAASGSVDIEDLDAPTLARFLAFLYTGAVGEDLQSDSALKLYYAADKYNVSSLKNDCVKFLSAHVSLSNVCDILSLADKHGDDHLTEVSHSFILGNYHQVLASENWKSFIKEEPSLAAQTLTDLSVNVRVKRQKCI